MAISIVNGNRGTATEKVDDTSLALTPSASLSAGNWGLLAVVVDNQSTAEGETNELSVTDSGGHTWTKLREQTEANTAADTGVTVALFLAKLTNGLTTSSTITISLDNGGSPAKGAGLAELSAASGFNIVLSTGGAAGTNEAGRTGYSVTLSGLSNVAGLYVGVTAVEGETDSDVALDSAYTEIGFGSIGSGIAGAPTSNVRARVGTLANTSTGDTFDAGVTGGDGAAILVRLEEVAAAIVSPAASATAAAPVPTIRIDAPTPAGSASAASAAPVPSITPVSPAASSTASAASPTPAIVVAAPAASSTAASGAPAIVAGPFIVVPSTNATASVAAPIVALSVVAPPASASGSAPSPTPLLSASAPSGSATAAVESPVPAILATSPPATSTAGSTSPLPALAVESPASVASGIAPAPTLSGGGQPRPFSNVRLFGT